MSSALDRVKHLRAGIDEQQDIQSRVILETNRKIILLKEQLDEAMVGAVDWAHETTVSVAEAGGYRNHSAIQEARERIAKRRVKIR